MDVINCRSDILENVVIREKISFISDAFPPLHNLCSGLVVVNESGDQTGLGQVEHGVHHEDSLVVLPDPTARVSALNLRVSQDSGAVPALEDVAEAVHQQEVAQLPVKPAASHGAQRVEGEVRDLGRVLALPHEVLQGEAEA